MSALRAHIALLEGQYIASPQGDISTRYCEMEREIATPLPKPGEGDLFDKQNIGLAVQREIRLLRDRGNTFSLPDAQRFRSSFLRRHSDWSLSDNDDKKHSIQGCFHLLLPI